MTGRNTTTRDKHRRELAQDEPPCHWCHEPIDGQTTPRGTPSRKTP